MASEGRENDYFVKSSYSWSLLALAIQEVMKSRESLQADLYFYSLKYMGKYFLFICAKKKKA